MSHFVNADCAARGWSEAIAALLEAPDHELVNLSVSIREPLVECAAVESHLDALLERHRLSNRSAAPPPVATVANTIFPAALYRPARADARARLYEARRRIAQRRRRFHRRGDTTYFDRLIDYPSRGESINQLERVIEQLRSARASGIQNGSLYELAIYEAKRDARPQGFPCLSHISLSLVSGTLHMTALYRNHYFLGRAYGNYVGLGRLLGFIARESGYKPGELLCVSSHATLDLPISDVRELYAACAAVLQQQVAA
jgi:hypothetical protein